MTEDQYRRIMRALRAANEAWVSDRPLTLQEQALVSDASLAVAELAAKSHLPITLAFERL